jgi:Asp-tRNA(Asn)/Glu-tRNA(Gln) amidotransferase A subunit family amidase
MFPPPLDEAAAHIYNGCTLPVNLAGAPALSLPVRTPGHLPASLQLVGPLRSEELLLATGLVVEHAAGQLIDR